MSPNENKAIIWTIIIIIDNKHGVVEQMHILQKMALFLERRGIRTDFTVCCQLDIQIEK